MDALQCILTRRSCRSYEDRPIPKKEILELLTVGTKAATGSGMQPWGFVTLEGREKIAALSDEIKAWLKENFADFLKAGYCAAGISGRLFDSKVIEQQDYAELTRRAQIFMKIAKENQ